MLDTGVYADHLDFGHRVIHSINLIMHEDENDMGGHGKYVFCSSRHLHLTSSRYTRGC